MGQWLRVLVTLEDFLSSGVGSSQLTVTPGSGTLMLNSGLNRNQACMWSTYYAGKISYT